MIDAATRRAVRERAGDRCEYCRLPHADQPLKPFHVEHIIAKQHQGSDDPDNLCWSCGPCNFAKGPNLSGIDAETGKHELLFNPRRQGWDEHFALRGAEIVGLTGVGRVTVHVLAMNSQVRIRIRAELIEAGSF